MPKKLPKRKAPKQKTSDAKKGVTAGRNAGAKQATKKNASKDQATGETKREKSGFPIVGIGASAGGLEALEELLLHMPADTGMAFVVVTHQHPGHASLLPELLGKATEMPVIEATDGLQVEPNHVYVGPPGGYLAILNGRLHRMDTGKETSPKLPIDYFFRSLAEEHRERAICIVLSGTGTDGTIGLKAIKRESGMAMVEQPQAAKYSGMPSSAIATGLVDYVLPPAGMSQQLVAYGQGPFLQSVAESPAVPDEPMQKIFVLLRSRTGHDFTAYKPNTLHRRVERRMHLHQIEKPNDYVRFLQENPHEIDILFKEFLISVTNFFRDPDAWDALAGAIEQLVKSRPTNSALRAWLPGCATGEEAFSLAITFRECMDRVQRVFDVQIFGTDLDSEAIEIARSGRYADGIAVDLSPERLQRYFTSEDNTFRIRKEIREMTIFAPQNVIKDPPFTKLDILVCRNMLIYLNADLQRKLLPIFHYALKPDGLLFLGPSETIGSFTDLFEPIDKRWKIFRRKECVTAMRALPAMPAQPLVQDRSATTIDPIARSGTSTHISTVFQNILLRRFAPASVLVNDRGDIIYFHGRTGAYLEPSQGQPRSNVLEMAREGLQMELATAMRQCTTTGKDVVREDIRVKSNGDFVHIDLSVAKLDNPETVRGLLLVTFRPKSPGPPEKPDKTKGRQKPSADGDRIQQLERELTSMRESHQTTREELETSNEELTTTNEELQSTNEELQSTNEELETSKEELQSLNEELTTVNAELQSKLDDLSQSNDDMQNLLNSTDIATVFLDNERHIKRFTEQAKDLVMLRQTDVGRPISDLASNLDYDELETDCEEVLKTLVFREREVSTKDGGAYLMRITPYRTTENVIDGLVITFVNLQQVKEVEKALHGLFESIVNTVRQPLLVLDKDHRVVAANDYFCKTFRIPLTEIVGVLISEIGDGEWNIPELTKVLKEILPYNSTFENFKVDHEFPKVGRKVLLLNARRLEREQGLPGLILLAMEDRTDKSPTEI